MSLTQPLQERKDIQALRGVYASMDELIGLRGANLQLALSGRRNALAAMAGAHRSAFRGRGIDFDEARIYQPGDDVRNIDWRVTARTGRTYTKLFREERERPVYIVVDQRASMFFGTQNAFKMGSLNPRKINKNPSLDLQVFFLVLPNVPGSPQDAKVRPPSIPNYRFGYQKCQGPHEKWFQGHPKS